jgi:hypothetical protein
MSPNDPTRGRGPAPNQGPYWALDANTLLERLESAREGLSA